MRKITTFTLNGKPVALKRRGSIAGAITKLLDKLPEGSLLTRREVAERVGCAQGSMPVAADLRGYAITVGSQVFWGSKRTIQQAEDAIGDND